MSYYCGAIAIARQAQTRQCMEGACLTAYSLQLTAYSTNYLLKKAFLLKFKSFNL